MAYLYQNVEGLYEHGFSHRSVHRLFQPPVKGTRSASEFHAVMNARLPSKRNSNRVKGEGVHFARAEQKLLREFMEYHGQPSFSGDDMSLIQVGRPAVSRYHQIRGFFPTGEGPNYDVHDFPYPEYNIKMGGFMVLGGRNLDKKRKASYHPY